jgi:3-oxoacyl-[acyl-carrier-protein] synthase-3
LPAVCKTIAGRICIAESSPIESVSCDDVRTVSLCARPRAVQILGTGVARPERRVESREIDARLGLDPGTVQRRSGVRARYVETQRSAASLGAEAARHALAAAGLSPEDVDCVVAAGASMDQAMPCNAALIHRELGLGASGIPAFDIGASCLGFLAAIDTLSWPLLAGRYRHVLIVAADIASCALDWTDLGASAIFGDGAAAAVLGANPQSGASLLASAFATYSDGAHLCEIPAGGSRHHPSRVNGNYVALAQFRMDGPAVFRLVTRHMPAFVDSLLQAAAVPRDELTLLVPHQASHLAMRHITRALGIERERMIDIYADHGNQVAASLPSALHIAICTGRLRRGDTALLLGSGAGVSLGGIVVRY